MVVPAIGESETDDGGDVLEKCRLPGTLATTERDAGEHTRRRAGVVRRLSIPGDSLATAWHPSPRGDHAREPIAHIRGQPLTSEP